jgi:hypothetical protein
MRKLSLLFCLLSEVFVVFTVNFLYPAFVYCFFSFALALLLHKLFFAFLGFCNTFLLLETTEYSDSVLSHHFTALVPNYLRIPSIRFFGKISFYLIFSQLVVEFLGFQRNFVWFCLLKGLIIINCLLDLCKLARFIVI